MKDIPVKHAIVRAMAAILAAGSVVGIFVCLRLCAVQQSILLVAICAMFALLYAGIGVAAIGLWRGRRLGLMWTRLLLLTQVPYLQTPWLIYSLFSGFSFNAYVGSQFGVNFFFGAQFNWRIMIGVPQSDHLVLGANVAALAAFLVLGRVQLDQRLNTPATEPREMLAAQE